MNITSLVVGTLASQVLFFLTKITFINYLNIDSPIILGIFFILLIVETIAVVRRMGILNIFESFFLASVWLIASLLVDIILTTSITGRDVYTHLYFWLTYLFIVLALIVFHKKAHVEARKANGKK